SGQPLVLTKNTECLVVHNFNDMVSSLRVTGGGNSSSSSSSSSVSTVKNIDLTTLSGSISAQYSDSPTGEGIGNLIDNKTNTKYLTFHNSAWVQYRAPAPYVVTRYSLTSA